MAPAYIALQHPLFLPLPQSGFDCQGVNISIWEFKVTSKSLGSDFEVSSKYLGLVYMWSYLLGDKKQTELEDLNGTCLNSPPTPSLPSSPSSVWFWLPKNQHLFLSFHWEEIWLCPEYKVSSKWFRRVKKGLGKSEGWIKKGLRKG